MRMSDYLQDVNFSRDSLYISDVCDLGFLEYLDGDLLTGCDLIPEFNFPECALTDGFAEDVLSDLPLVWLELELWLLRNLVCE